MTFGAGLFLWTALAGAIPVLLHMINRQKAPVVHFSTLRFLRISVEKTRRRKRIHDLLLLLLRVAMLMLIAFALAQPAVRWLHSWFGGQASTAIVLILDNSGSQATTDQDGPRFDRVKVATTQVLNELQGGDQVALLVTNGRPLLPSRDLFQNHEIVRRALDSCHPSFERADLVAALDEARRLLRNASSPNKEIYIVTDMQACCWTDAKSGQAGREDEEAGPPVVIVDVSGPNLPNSALTRIEIEATAPVAGIPLKVTTDLQGDAQVIEERNIGLYVDGEKRDSSPTLRIEPGQLTQHTFDVQLSGKNLHRGDIRLEGEDACSADDRLYFAANTDPAVPIAIVKPADHEIRNLDQAFYLERALTPQGDREGAILVSSMTPAAVATETLSRFVIVFCVDLPAPAPDLARQLLAYVQSGGNLIWICGENVDAVEYNNLNDQLDGKLLPMRLGGIRQANDERPDGWHISWLDPDDPVVAPFVEPASIHQSVQMDRYVEGVVIEASNSRVLARLDEGQPLLVKHQVGSGSIYFLATSLHVDWTNFPLRSLFLPFVSRLTFELAGSNASQPLLIAGLPWSLPVAGGEDVSVEVVKPNRDVVRITRTESDSGPVRFTDTYEVGIYETRIHRGERTQRTAFAVNPDPAESAPGRLDREVLEQRLEPTRVFFCDDASKVSQTIRDLRKGLALSGVFLILVLVALVGEAYQANRRALNPDRLAK